MKIKKNGKIITLTESDIKKITKKVLSEQGYVDDYGDDFDEDQHIKYMRDKRNSVKESWETLSKIASGGGECAELANSLEIILKDMKSNFDSGISRLTKY